MGQRHTHSQQSQFQYVALYHMGLIPEIFVSERNIRKERKKTVDASWRINNKKYRPHVMKEEEIYQLDD